MGSGSNFQHGLGTGMGQVAEMLDPHTTTEHLKCVKTIWRLRAEVSFTSVEEHPGYGPVVLAV